MKRKVILILFTLSILFLCINIKALVIRPESTTSQVIRGENFNVSIYVDVENEDPDIYGIEGKINYDSTKFTLNSATLNNTLNSWTEFSNPKTNGNNIFSIGSIQFQNPINADKTIYTLNFTVKEVATLGNSTFSIGNLSTSDNNANPVSVSGGEKTINIVSNDATLSSLSVTGYNISPTFNKNTTSYTLNVAANISSITINGTKSDTNASVTGTGVKTLSYGTNTFNVVVTAADGVTTKTYIINVNKSLSTEAKLTSLSLSKGSLSPIFNSNISNYTAIVEYDVSSIIINATASTSAKMIGTGEKTLKVGENKFTIIVTSADNSKISNYYITITRKTNKSIDNTIKSLSLLIGTQTKNIELKNSQTTYDIDIDDKTATSLEIEAELNDIKSNFVNNFGPRKVELNVGNNVVLLKVLSESGLEKVYTININFNNKEDKQIIEDYNPITNNPTPIVDTKNKLNIFIVIIIVICSIIFANILAKIIQKKIKF